MTNDRETTNTVLIYGKPQTPYPIYGKPQTPYLYMGNHKNRTYISSICTQREYIQTTNYNLQYTGYVKRNNYRGQNESRLQ